MPKKKKTRNRRSCGQMSGALRTAMLCIQQGPCRA